MAFIQRVPSTKVRKGLLLAGLTYLVGPDGVGIGQPIINRLLFQTDGVPPGYLFPVRFAGRALSQEAPAAPPETAATRAEQT